MKELVPSGVAPFDKVTFIGIDWGTKETTACKCPRCRTVHHWRKRTPKRCRHCSLPFNFTANVAELETTP